MTRTLVLGAGIVGTASAWDLARRGHEVTVADIDLSAAEAAAEQSGARAARIDVTNRTALGGSLSGYDLVISAVPYHHGASLARAAIAGGAHYADFGGNPTVVTQQRDLHNAAHAAGVAVIPDCGLAPGIANVMAESLITAAEDGPIESVQLRVGVLPQRPTGALGYQLAFSPAGLINEYAEPCEILEEGRYLTVEPLTRFEEVSWKKWGPLEAFATSGGTSSMCQRHVGRVGRLEYKALRYPHHGKTFRALYELGMFDEQQRDVAGTSVSPRAVLIDALATALPREAPDVALVRVWLEAGGRTRVIELEDVHDGTFSALARTTAFPTTALADLITRGEVAVPGVHTMSEATTLAELEPELESVGIAWSERS
jgi:lysine 6-dehydrogenase